MAKTEKEILVDISDKVDELKDRIHSIDVTVAKQEVNLQDHMRRTVINEEKLDMFEDKIAPALDAYKFIATFCKVLTGAAIIIGAWFKFKS